MKTTFKSVLNFFRGIKSDLKHSEEEQKEIKRLHRRMTKFPRIKGAANPFAMRNALFMEKYNLKS